MGELQEHLKTCDYEGLKVSSKQGMCFSDWKYFKDLSIDT